MTLLKFEGALVEASAGQTVLDAFEAAGILLDSSCRAGACQSCLLQSVNGTVPKASQVGLSRALAQDGYFMACVCVPEEPMTIARAGEVRQRVAVTLRSCEWLSASVVRLQLEPKRKFLFRPGQFVSLIDPDSQLVRSYSIAGARAGLIELHVRIIPGGKMSALVSSPAARGRRMIISGPSGACCYEDTDRDRRIVLAGIGTGLAPLWAILNVAIAHGHRGPINLFHGALDRSGLYLVEELQALQAQHSNFNYFPCVRDPTDPSSSDFVGVVTRAERQPTDTTFYLCGDEALVNRLRRALFLAGAALESLRADRFVAAAQPQFTY